LAVRRKSPVGVVREGGGRVVDINGGMFLLSLSNRFGGCRSCGKNGFLLNFWRRREKKFVSK
jgi:hypothetical protein